MDRWVGRGTWKRKRRVARVVAAAVIGGLTAAVIGGWTVVAPAQAQSDDGATGDGRSLPDDRVTVVMTELAPFVVDDQGRPDGFYAEIWDEVARELGVDYDVMWVDSFGQLLDEVESGRADVAVAPLAPTADRETRLDFSSAVISSGPQLGYHERLDTSTSVLRAVLSWQVLRILLVAIAGLVILANVIWLVERRHPGSHFDEGYRAGIWDGFWWATVTVTTVGYGDKAPQSTKGRVVALFGMLLSLFLVGAFVSQVTSVLSSSRTVIPFTTLDELGDEPVAVVGGSTFAAFVELEGAVVVPYDSQAEVFAAAAAGEVNAVIANPFALASLGPRHGVVPTGDVFYQEFETFGLAQGSPWREPINRALADLQAQGEVAEIIDRWSD
ncbi:MAG: transporter substrate-binding domain-containing protein [Actinomycetota bacterium]